MEHLWTTAAEAGQTHSEHAFGWGSGGLAFLVLGHLLPLVLQPKLAILSYSNSLLKPSSYISQKMFLLLLLQFFPDKVPHLHSKIRDIPKTIIINSVVSEIYS